MNDLTERRITKQMFSEKRNEIYGKRTIISRTHEWSQYFWTNEKTTNKMGFSQTMNDQIKKVPSLATIMFSACNSTNEYSLK